KESCYLPLLRLVYLSPSVPGGNYFGWVAERDANTETEGTGYLKHIRSPNTSSSASRCGEGRDGLGR
ncbi:MAG: hypothetical protein WBJ85_04125, partial [Acetomicrobium sp.]